MKIIKLNAALKSLKKLNDEIRYADFVKESNFTSGLIAFRAGKQSDPKQINHNGTPHDFAAGRSSELVLFYALIKTT
jgi:hypothetical protein